MPLLDDAYIQELRSRLEPCHKKDDPAKHGEGDPKTAEKAFERVERLVGIKERSAQGMTARLLREGFTPEDAQAALDRAKAYGIIDDARFADSLIRGRLRAGKGKQGIEQELKQLSIPPESIPGWPNAFGLDEGEDEVTRAVELLTKKPPKSANLQGSAYRKLIRNGYSPSTAITATRIWMESL